MNSLFFNKPYLTGNEIKYLGQAMRSGKIAGNGMFTLKCQEFFEKRYGFNKCLLTHSCTGALEMAAILINIQRGDEVIMPSFTFPSTANAFILRGAKIIFCDCEQHTPNIDACKIEKLISKKTKAIVVVHYAGVSCDMNKILNIARKNNLFVIEDASHAVDSFYKNRAVGSIGHFGCFSFHESKNIISGEGGLLVINDEKFVNRAEIILEKGTDRLAFLRGEYEQYRWMDIGSSFALSEILAAVLYAQLMQLDKIQKKRKAIWENYYKGLKALYKKEKIKLPLVPAYAVHNAHIFYLLCKNLQERNALIKHLQKKKVQAVFHYFPLHNSPFYKNKNDKRELPMADIYSDCIIRLPLFYEMKKDEINKVISAIKNFYQN